MAAGFSVFVNIGGKVLPSLDRAVATAKAQVATLERASRLMSFGSVGGGLAAVAAAQAANARRLERMQSQLVGAGAAAWGLGAALRAPVVASTQFETGLEDIRQKSDLTSEAIAGLSRRIRDFAPKVNLRPIQFLTGMDKLMSYGASADVAEGMMSPIGRAATAYRAQVDDLAQASYALFDNLKVPVDQLTKALDVMAESAKRGAFEFNDMGAAFPSLSAAAQPLGFKGTAGVARLSAGLQIARGGAGTSGEAANNVANLLQKVNAPEAVKKFKKLGVDIRGVLKKTIAGGGDIFEVIAAQTMKALGGDLSKLGDLFEDRQVQQALRPLIQNLEEYRKIRDASLAADGVVAKDFEARMRTAAAAGQAFAVQLERISIALGNALLPPITGLLRATVPFTESLERIASQNPVVTRTVVGLAAGLVGLKVAGIAARWSLAWLWGGALATAAAGLRGVAIASAAAQAALLPFGAAARATRTAMIGLAGATAILGSGGALKVAAAGMLGLLNPLRLLRGVAAGVGVALRGALAFSGIGAAIAVVGAGVAFLYNNWRGLLTFATSFGSAFMEALGPQATAALSTVAGWVSKLFGWVGSLVGEIDATGEAWRRWGTAAGQWVGGVVNAVANLPQTLGAAWTAMVSGIESTAAKLSSAAQSWVSDMASAISGAAGQLYAAGVALIDSLWAGLKARFDAILGWARGLGARIGGAVSGVLGGVSTPAAVGAPTAATAAPALAGARAWGGPVLAGRPYLVGERGPEIFVPSQAGRVETNGMLRRLTDTGTAALRESSNAASGRGDVTLHVTQNITGGDDPRRVAEEVRREMFVILNRLESEQRGLLSD